MRVSDLAKELGTTSDGILARLKSLKLKAKDSKQELNEAVIAVLRRELGKSKDSAKTKEPLKEPVLPKGKVKAEKKTPVKAKSELQTKEKGKKAVPLKVKKEETKAVAKKSAAGKPAVEKKTPVAARPRIIPKAALLSPMVARRPLSEPSIPVKERPVSVPTAPPLPRAVPPLRPTPRPEAKDIRKEKPVFQKVVQPSIEAKVEIKGPPQALEIQLPASVKDLSVKLQQKPSVLLKKLLEKGIFANINQSLSEEVVHGLASDFGFILTPVKTQEEQLIAVHKIQEEDKQFLKPRAPVVTFMGHVDHGKTSLLDRIRKSKVADEEHGGITQHIGAYSVNLPKGRITFLDTPGHEAFTSMRARGANITDLVVLVVAADEGIMPQTEEAIDHARAAGVPIIVALNKIDKKGADIDRVKKQLSEAGLAPEDWGGKTIVAGVSAATGEGIDNLLEMILLEAELLELKANYEKKASGVIVEAQLTRDRGPIVTVIVQHGTLKEGDAVVVGPYVGKVKAMFDDVQRPVKEAGPSVAVEILGLSNVPEAGEKFYVIEDEREARLIAERRQEQIKDRKMQPGPKITLEDIYAQIKEGKIKELNIILKADVRGSLEALKDSLLKLPAEEVKLRFIHTGVGEINTSDVILGSASNAIIIGFNIDVSPRAQVELEKQSVEVRTYRIIYDAINDIKNALSGLLEPKTKKKFLGRVEVRQVFKLSKSGIVAGCYVAKGKIHRKANIEVLRNGQAVFSGTLASLKRFKDDVREVAEGFECGIVVNGFPDVQPGDIIEAHELEKIARTL